MFASVIEILLKVVENAGPLAAPNRISVYQQNVTAWLVRVPVKPVTDSKPKLARDFKRRTTNYSDMIA
ncbi:hypothetical protein [Methylomonas sp. DH-1]|uniref:hypothetical protein n=1 Tax=Methylomonas sp. (strain DH-1) TaxID=1727196 RepID=UPI0007C94EAA|nr:hypothetical protein [Methylomonas sp. DH-1]ANE56125.1 hypothetical protein AYM39_13680 [Methylomonas sp. DH-1]